MFFDHKKKSLRCSVLQYVYFFCSNLTRLHEHCLHIYLDCPLAENYSISGVCNNSILMRSFASRSVCLAKVRKPKSSPQVWVEMFKTLLQNFLTFSFCYLNMYNYPLSFQSMKQDTCHLYLCCMVICHWDTYTPIRFAKFSSPKFESKAKRRTLFYFCSSQSECKQFWSVGIARRLKLILLLKYSPTIWMSAYSMIYPCTMLLPLTSPPGLLCFLRWNHTPKLQEGRTGVIQLGCWWWGCCGLHQRCLAQKALMLPIQLQKTQTQSLSQSSLFRHATWPHCLM